MIYSRSAEYALRALTQLAALPPDEYAMAKNIAAEGNIPGHFLAKILQDLARDGFLASYLDLRVIQGLVDRHRSGAEDATDRLWRLLNLQLWGDVFITGNRDRWWAGALASPVAT